jgi:hypothetical protein
MTTVESPAIIGVDVHGPADPSLTVTRTKTEDALAAEIAQLKEGLATRTVIGQATGIVAGRLHVSTGTAWEIVRRASTDCNIKVRRVADIIVASHDKKRPHDEDPAAHEITRILGFDLD